jgi:hypothetical protein
VVRSAGRLWNAVCEDQRCQADVGAPTWFVSLFHLGILEYNEN